MRRKQKDSNFGKDTDHIRHLYTPEGEKLSDTPWDSYPRPQMRRSEWLSLNGKWTFRTSDEESSDILVPFCPESILSGYKGDIISGTEMHYQRSFDYPASWCGRRIILHFGAVSNKSKIFINRKQVFSHKNGYIPFEIDITEVLNSPGKGNIIEVIAINDLSGELPTGKQKAARGGMWYTPVSGIWQSVWLEPVFEDHISGLKITPDMNGADITVEGVYDAVIICEGNEYRMTSGKVRIEPETKRLWTPESPELYTFTVKSGNDSVESYFALRSLSVRTFAGIPRLCLNEKPYFFNGLLDQGYFSDGIYTPASYESYAKDILAMKALGFNTLRKHIKIEPEQFYYDCDRLGMVVFQDMVNNSDYSFFRDTLLPTLGLTRVSDRRMHRDPNSRAEFLDAMEKTVSLLYNHPCICYWTIFNEGWGQFESDRAYEKLKALDPGRFTDSTSGWFCQNKSDVESLHIYFKKLHLGKNKNLPQVLSEFGGYVYKSPEHSFNLRKTYGYKIFTDRDSYRKAMRLLYSEEILPLAKKGLSAAVCTQVSDVEDETNGILTYDRKECKLVPEDLHGIAMQIREHFQSLC